MVEDPVIVLQLLLIAARQDVPEFGKFYSFCTISGPRTLPVIDRIAKRLESLFKNLAVLVVVIIPLNRRKVRTGPLHVVSLFPPRNVKNSCIQGQGIDGSKRPGILDEGLADFGQRWRTTLLLLQVLYDLA